MLTVVALGDLLLLALESVFYAHALTTVSRFETFEEV